jgi:NDP-sugar pyrophosphorylase family protein
VTDLRNELGRAIGTHVFSGIYCVNPEFIDLLPAGEIISVIPALLELARVGKLGALVLDEGVWLDLGDRDSYLKAHRELDLGPAIHPAARIVHGANIENSIIGQDVAVASGAVIRDSVIWKNLQISGNAVLNRCIAFSGNPVTGIHEGKDL